jgi:ABC-type transporter Mla subunit MlaD
LSEKIDSKWEQTLGNLNQLGERIARQEGKVEEATRSLDRQGATLAHQSDKIEHWIERVVKVETTRRSRASRAG